MTTLNEEVFRIKEMMGLEEVPSSLIHSDTEEREESSDYHPEDEEVIEKEIDEQEEETSTDSDSGGDAPSSPAMSTWDSGVNRGPGNPVAVGKWSDTYDINRGKANKIDNSKWESGINRGKSNPLW